MAKEKDEMDEGPMHEAGESPGAEALEDRFEFCSPSRSVPSKGNAPRSFEKANPAKAKARRL